MPQTDNQEEGQSIIKEADVVSYLMRHPDFLDRHHELLHTLTPPEYRKTDESVIDMQQFMVDKLRKEIGNLQTCFGEVVFSARENLSVQGQMHEAVIRLLSAEGMQGILQVLRQDFPALFNLDIVTLCLETDIASMDTTLPDTHPLARVRLIPRGTMAQLFARNKSYLGVPPVQCSDLFGEGADLVTSCALVPLDFDTRSGILAFGTRDPERFYPGMATDLLHFLSKIVALCVHKLKE